VNQTAAHKEAAASASHATEGLGGKIIRRQAQLASQRSRIEHIIRDCYDHSYPLRGADFSTVAAPGGFELNIGYGATKKALLLDSTASDGCRILAAAMVSGATPSNSRWFGLDVEGADEEGKAWLDSAADTLWTNIHNSNYDSVAFESMLDLVIAGSSCLFVDEDAERGGFRFEMWSLAQCFFAASKPGGRIDTVYRKHALTAEQAVNRFGIEKVSEAIAKAYYDNPDQTFEFIHAIYPRAMYMPGARLAKNLPIASCYVEVATKKIVSESGFHEMPCIVPRWMLIPGSHLAVGPMFEALPDVRTLNKLIEFVMTNADLAIAGMWIAEDDGVLNPRTIKIGPRKVVVANSVDSMKPLQPASKFDVAVMEIDRLQKAIRKVLMADQLTPQDGPAMTATEVHVRVELIRQLLGPVYGRLQAEYLQPLVERCFGIAYRAGVFLAPPRSIADREMSVRYISPLARSQKAVDVAAMDRFEYSLANTAAATGREDLLDIYDVEEAQRVRAENLGVPLKLLKTEEEVAEIRDARAQKQAAQSAAAVAGQAAAGAMPGGKVDGGAMGAALAGMAGAGARRAA
jgi:hypothetical protein